MSLILHLSDIHLARGGELVGDYTKSPRVIPPKEAPDRTDLLRSTLESLGDWLDRSKRTLDAIVVSGDVTFRANEDGFELLPSLLDALGTAKPDSDRIVVVPGNHDVAWGTRPSTGARYERFATCIDSAGFARPFLDGIDNPPKRPSDFRLRYVLAGDGAWAIVPLNSSNYCGVTELEAGDAPNETEETGATSFAEAPVKTTYDVARISPFQFRCLRQILEHLDDTTGDTVALRLLTLHHHLAPVSTEEEIKAFESITNLGHLRRALRDNRIDVVLHGHKHTGYVYWDHIYGMPMAGAEDDHRVLVVSGSTLLGADYRREEVCRLLRLDARRHASSVLVSRIPAVDASAHLPDQRDWRQFLLWSRDAFDAVVSENATRIDGETVDEVYNRVLSLFERPEGLSPPAQILNLICQIRDPATARRLPDRYPPLDQARDDWFRDIVGFWQLESFEPSPRVRFNHGFRIAQHDQLKRVIRAINEDRRPEGRLLVALFDPLTDTVDDAQQRFPSFCSVQFELRRDGAATYLDCVGYFRKHEVRWWWPINVGEMARMQDHVHQKVAGSFSGGLRLGTLTTISIYAHQDSQPPTVAVPRIDRETYEPGGMQRLEEMAYAIVQPAIRRRADFRAEWIKLAEELIPPIDFDLRGDTPVAVAGLQVLHEHLKLFSDLGYSKSPADVADILSSIASHNDRYLEQVLRREADADGHSKWRELVVSDVERLRAALERVSWDEQPHG